MAELSDAERDALIMKNLEGYTAESKQATANANAVQRTEYPGAIARGNIPLDSPNIGAGEAASRGFLSGLSMGFQPQISGAVSAINPFDPNSYSQTRDKEAAANTRAFDQQGKAYGGGYAGGALSLGLLTGGLGDLALGAKGLATAAEAVPAARGMGFLADVAPKAAKVAKPGMFDGLLNSIRGTAASPLKITVPKIGQAAGSVTGASVNELQAPANSGEVTPGNRIPGITGAPLSYNNNEQDNTTSGSMFGSLADFLDQARNSDNPEVQKQASEAYAALNNDPSDDDAKRRIAMQLNSTRTGRAVGNEDSPENA